MKTKTKFFGALIALFLFSSCGSINYYQVYKATPSEKINVKDDRMIYEDSNCIIGYNLWKDGGDIGFNFYNKTDKNIYLNLDESFFILNGIANNYYKNRIFTNSSGGTVNKSTTGYNYFSLYRLPIAVSSSTTNTTSSGYSVAYAEEKIICIPPRTSKLINEYSINNILYRDCDLLRHPSKKQIKNKNFTKSNSPIIFSNRIAYKTSVNENLIVIDNEFFVSEITNLPKSEMFISKTEEFCGEKNTSPIQISKEKAPNKFYIQYNVDQFGSKY